MDEEGAVDDVPHLTNNDEDSAGPQLPPVALPQAKLPHKLDEEGVADDVPHVADDDDKDSARPQLPPVALLQAESPHKLDEEGAVNDVPHVTNDNEDSAEPQPPPVALPQAKSPHELGEESAVGNIPLHSVKIYVGYVNNMMTLCCLRHPNGRPADSTIYTMLTDQLKGIKSTSDMCPLIQP